MSPADCDCQKMTFLGVQHINSFSFILSLALLFNLNLLGCHVRFEGQNGIKQNLTVTSQISISFKISYWYFTHFIKFIFPFVKFIYSFVYFLLVLGYFRLNTWNKLNLKIQFRNCRLVNKFCNISFTVLPVYIFLSIFPTCSKLFCIESDYLD